MLGKNLLQLYPELVDRGLAQNYKDAMPARSASCLNDFTVISCRCPPRSKEYSYMQQSVRICPISHDGEVIGTLTIIDDVTERVVREIELQSELEVRSKLLVSESAARREAEDANRLKDEFLGHHLSRTANAAVRDCRMGCPVAFG